MIEYLFSPSGRFNRMQWWLFGLVQMAGILIATVMVVGGTTTNPAFAVAGALMLFPVAWGGICANIKRFHDRGKSGWWLLISFVPFIGSIWIMVELGMLGGDEGDNAFGPPPGSARRLAALDKEIGAMSNGRLAKIDDDYFKQYQAKAAAQASAAMARTTLQPANGGRPAFGKRV